LKKPFTGWFDKAGHFVALPFQQMFASNISVIGEADPERVVQEKKKAVRIEDGKSNDEKWAALLAESSGEVSGTSTATATPGKGKKRGKKA
jgi:signal peptidase complex subunit 2